MYMIKKAQTTVFNLFGLRCLLKANSFFLHWKHHMFKHKMIARAFFY